MYLHYTYRSWKSLGKFWANLTFAQKCPAQSWANGGELWALPKICPNSLRAILRLIKPNL